MALVEDQKQAELQEENLRVRAIKKKGEFQEGGTA